MRALVIADPQIPVPPIHYGGIERTIHLLCEGLFRRGWTVDLMAAAGSKTYGGGRLIVHAPPTTALPSRAYRKIWFQIASLRAATRADVVVSFGRIDYLWAMARTHKPLVVAFQNPVQQSELDAVTRVRAARVRFVGISRSQMAGLAPVNRIDVVYNATDANAMRFIPSLTGPLYVAFLGRLTGNKGVHLAIEASRAAGVRLVIAGTVSGEPGGEEYFLSRVKPQLGVDIEYIGPVDDAQKSQLLGGALALLFPIQWPEPFGIVMAEALACGCPVIGWRNGSVPEVVDDGVTGFVVDSIEQMADAIRRVHLIDRTTCRRVAEARFSPEAMVDGYLAAIEQARVGT